VGTAHTSLIVKPGSHPRCDYEGLHLSSDLSWAKLRRDRFGGLLRSLLQPTRIASFDLIAERCALAEANCNFLRRRGSAHLLNRVDLDALEPSLSQPIANGS